MILTRNVFRSVVRLLNERNGKEGRYRWETEELKQTKRLLKAIEASLKHSTTKSQQKGNKVDI